MLNLSGGVWNVGTNLAAMDWRSGEKAVEKHLADMSADEGLTSGVRALPIMNACNLRAGSLCDLGQSVASLGLIGRGRAGQRPDVSESAESWEGMSGLGFGAATGKRENAWWALCMHVKIDAVMDPYADNRRD